MKTYGCCKRTSYDFPLIKFKNSYSNLEDYKWEDIEIINYQCHSSIKVDMIA